MWEKKGSRERQSEHYWGVFTHSASTSHIRTSLSDSSLDSLLGVGLKPQVAAANTSHYSEGPNESEMLDAFLTFVSMSHFVVVCMVHAHGCVVI